MSGITVNHREHDGTLIATYQPENLQFTLNKGENGCHVISYEISRAIVTADFVGPYRTDFELLVDGSAVNILSGMHTNYSIQSNEEHVKIAGKDWLHYLEKRYWPYDDSNPNFYRFAIPTTDADHPPTGYAYFQVARDSALIVKDMLDQVLSLTDSLNLTYTLTAMGYTVDVFTIDLIDTENILSKIQTLSQEDDGEFDFWVEPDQEFVIYPGRQYNIGVVSDPTMAIHTFDYADQSTGMFELGFTNNGPLETRLIGTGSNPSSSLAAVRAYAPSSAVFRLLENNISFGDVFNGDRVQKLTRKNLLFDLNPIHDVSLTVIPESVTNFWSDFKPGKAIWVTGDLDGHLVDSAQEIVAIDGSCDADGNLIASLRLNQIYTPATL